MLLDFAILLKFPGMHGKWPRRKKRAGLMIELREHAGSFLKTWFREARAVGFPHSSSVLKNSLVLIC